MKITMTNLYWQELIKTSPQCNAPEESEELYRYTIAGITTIVYTCGTVRFALAVEENPQPYTSDKIAQKTTDAYSKNLWHYANGG